MRFKTKCIKCTLAMNKRIKEAMKSGQKYSQSDLCKFSTQHDGHCYKTNGNWSVAVAEEHLCEEIGKRLLVDEDGNYLGDHKALFAQKISSDNDTRSPQRLMQSQNKIIGEAADGKARQLPDRNHVIKNTSNDIYSFRGKDKTVGSGVSGLNNERIAWIKSDLNRIGVSYQLDGIGDKNRPKYLELVNALIPHHCGDHSQCKHKEFCTFAKVKSENPTMSNNEVEAEAAKQSTRCHKLSLDKKGISDVTNILLKRFGPKSIDNSAAGGCSNFSEAFWNCLTKFTEGKRINVDHTDLWTSVNQLVFIRSGNGNIEQTHQDISEQLSLPLSSISQQYRKRADEKQTKDQARAKSEQAKQARCISKITKSARMGKEEAKDRRSRYKTEKVKLSETQTSTMRKAPRSVPRCSKCGQPGHTKRSCKMPAAPKKRTYTKLLDFGIEELDGLEKFMQSKKKMKTIDTSMFGDFDDLFV